MEWMKSLKKSDKVTCDTCEGVGEVMVIDNGVVVYDGACEICDGEGMVDRYVHVADTWKEAEGIA